MSIRLPDWREGGYTNTIDPNRGYVPHEFVPSRDPFTSLRQAADLCDV
jgi:hypothetical protein